MIVRLAKTKVSLGIRPVWSESSLCAQWVAKEPGFLHTDSEDWSDWADTQADLSLRWAHTHFVDFVCRGSYAYAGSVLAPRGYFTGLGATVRPAEPLTALRGSSKACTGPIGPSGLLGSYEYLYGPCTIVYGSQITGSKTRTNHKMYERCAYLFFSHRLYGTRTGPKSFCMISRAFSHGLSCNHPWVLVLAKEFDVTGA